MVQGYRTVHVVSAAACVCVCVCDGVCVCLSHSHHCGRSAVHLLLQLHHLLHVLGLGEDETSQSEFPTEACYPVFNQTLDGLIIMVYW